MPLSINAGGITTARAWRDTKTPDWCHYLKYQSNFVCDTQLQDRGQSKTCLLPTYGPRRANLVLIAYASSEGSGKPAHPRSLARTSAARSYKQ